MCFIEPSKVQTNYPHCESNVTKQTLFTLWENALSETHWRTLLPLGAQRWKSKYLKSKKEKARTIVLRGLFVSPKAKRGFLNVLSKQTKTKQT